jgi:hypothetical protein
MTVYGYARVSTDGQTLDAQIVALKAAGAEKVYSEKQSGAKTDRAALACVLAALGSGDVPNQWADTTTAHGRLMLKLCRQTRPAVKQEKP